MTKQKQVKTTMRICLLLLILFFSVLCAIGMGPVKIPFAEIIAILFEKCGFTANTEGIGNNLKNIVIYIRVPRVLLSGIVGAGLALSGVAMQCFTKNPLADPYILGISSGASMGAVLASMTGILAVLGAFRIPLGAFTGALMAIVIVYMLARSKQGLIPIRLVLVGVAVSALFSAATNFMVYNAKYESQIRNATFWMMGGFAGAKWSYLPIPFVILVFSLVAMYCLSSALDAMLLGDDTAHVLGVNVTLVRRAIVLLSAILTGSVVAVSGCIGFVGLLIPHIVRMTIGSNHIRLIPVAAIMGAVFLIWADVLARLIYAPSELPIGIITSAVGAPFFIWLIRKNKYYFGE